MPETRLTRDEMKALLEALIYVSEEPLKEQEIRQTLGQEDPEVVRQALEELVLEYAAVPRGIRIVRVAGGYRMQTRPEHDPWIRALYRQRNKVRLSRAALETLAIIAYRQPVTGPEIQSIRGAHPMGVLQTLLERRLIRTLGRKKVVGKPILYGTTEEFLVHFGLNSLSDLPSLEDFPGMESAAAPKEGDVLEGIPADGPEIRGGVSAEDDASEGEWQDTLVEPLLAMPMTDGSADEEEE